MAGESMSYPLRYGYSLVGRVAKCGEGVDPEKFIGKVVFTFSPHSSWVVADVGGVSLVPEVRLDRVVLFTAMFVRQYRRELSYHGCLAARSCLLPRQRYELPNEWPYYTAMCSSSLETWMGD